MPPLVLIRIRHEVCRVIATSNITKDLKNGDIYFEPICKYLGESPKNEPRWEKIGELN